MSTRAKLKKWPHRLLSTLLAWLAAFGVVYVLQLVAGEWLESLPEAVHVLVLTGILVTIMGNVLMPAINTFIARIDA